MTKLHKLTSIDNWSNLFSSFSKLFALQIDLVENLLLKYQIITLLNLVNLACNSHSTLFLPDSFSFQVNLYLLSRIIYGLAQLSVKKGYLPKPTKEPFPMFAALVWGIALLLFEYERDILQTSMKSSMTYLYDDSNTWHSLKDFLIYNK